MIRLLFVGDIVGSAGRRVVRDHLERIIDEEKVDFVVVNLENAAGGFGITPKVLAELDQLPVSVWTSGNHIWDKKDGVQALDAHPYLLRPANYPDGNPGRGWCVEATPAGTAVAVVNLQGTVFMSPLDNPFHKADRILEEIAAAHPEVRLVLVDFHAEATSEKVAMGWHLDGRVTAVLGTHTHIPTADERVLPGGTAFQTDVGMTGPYDSVIGMKTGPVLHRFLYQTPRSFEVAKRGVGFRGALIEADPDTGKAAWIRRITVKP